MVLFLKIVGGIVALGIGLYFGSSGGYRPPDEDEIDKALEEDGYPRRVKTHFTPLGWLRNTQERSSHVRRRSRGTSSGLFNLSAPDSDKDDQ